MEEKFSKNGEDAWWWLHTRLYIKGTPQFRSYLSLFKSDIIFAAVINTIVKVT